ncbi:DEAD/DEAH box helicase family protein, partial [Staphylococcus aureus]|uniref:DEAD/DEAH box helicase family protein n=1 Tax=Staphylococcus aureus TaxID=1280 RepID=UPI001CF57F10
QVPIIEPYEAIPDVQEVTIGTKTITPREDQVKAVRAAFDQQRGLIDSATNSGKTLMAALILKYASSDGKFLFIAPSANVMNQAKKTFEAITGEEVGTWQGDHVDIKRI